MGRARLADSRDPPIQRRYGANLSRQTGHNRLVQAAVLQRFIEQFGGRDVLAADLISRRLGKIYYSAARQYFREGCFAQSAAALATALTYRPIVKARAYGW